jgi:hypothetical protein
MLTATSIEYECSERSRGIGAGGVGAFHDLANRIGLVDSIDRYLHVLKVHLPYHESDHVLNVAYNALCGGTCLEDIELRRNDEVFLDALGAQRIPDPTTAGDFCRRFNQEHIEALQEAYNEVRLRIWRLQPESFLEEAVIDVDGTIVSTTGECKEGMDFAYNGTWGYQVQLISLANTAEPLFLVCRGGNRPSEEGMAEYLDKAIALCRRAGFRKITLRGDTAFSQTRYLDGWDRAGVRFVFGYDARENLQEIAANLPPSRWSRLRRPEKYTVKTKPRRRPENVKERVVVQREFKNIKLESEHVAEFAYTPTFCKEHYWMVVVEKDLSVEQGERVLFPDFRRFFYITNRDDLSKSDVVFEANKRCNQENLIDQLKNGVRSLKTPVGDLLSNWAYMVMASLAWSLKAWFALILPEAGRWKSKYQEEKTKVLRMDFKTFVNFFVLMPAQVVKTGRRIVFRLLSWNPCQHIFVRALEQLQAPLLC